jgi:hypothetical protein
MLVLKISLHSYLFDLLTNTYLNDFYLNSFFFLWTQFFLLPLFLLLIYYINLIKFLKNTNILSICLQKLFFVIVLWLIYDYFNLNQFVYITKSVQYYFNNLLINPLNKYHPALFFSAYISTYSILTYKHLFNNLRTFYPLKFFYKTTYNKIFIKNIYYYLLMLTALYLGAWWALQEGSWGGWWNWDASEVFGLFILTVLLVIFHVHKNYIPYLLQTKLTLSLLLLIFLLYCMIQLSYTLVSHNFGLSLVGYGFVQSTLTGFIIFILIGGSLLSSTLLSFFRKILLTKETFLRNLNNPLKLKYLQVSKLIIIVSLLFISYIYINSFNPIINNIFWKAFNIEILNKWFTWVNINILTLIVFYVILLRYNWLILVASYVYLLNYTYYTIPILLLTQIKHNLPKLFHLTILLLLIIPLVTENVLFSKWETLNKSFTSWLNIYTRIVFRNNIYTENTYVYINFIDLGHLTSKVINSFFQFHHNIDSQFFSLTLSETNLNQTIHNHTFMYLFKVVIFDQASLLTDLSLTIIYFLLYYILSFKIKIIF